MSPFRPTLTSNLPRCALQLHPIQFIKIAKDSKVICDKYKIPLIINDRVDVALAVGATGVHLGQDDMDIAQARKLLPSGTVIGISCNTPEQVAEAVKAGADYVGIGAVWGTQTKDVTNKIIGVRSVGERLKELDGSGVKAVAIGEDLSVVPTIVLDYQYEDFADFFVYIGGIKSGNLWRTLHGSVSVTGHALDGVAVVSEIMASTDPRGAAASLSKLVKAFKEEHARPRDLAPSKNDIIDRVSELVAKIREVNPLVHQVRNKSKFFVFTFGLSLVSFSFRLRTTSLRLNLRMSRSQLGLAQLWPLNHRRWKIWLGYVERYW